MLEARDLSYAYDSVVLESVSLSLPAGSLVALTGPNGSGKSTLLKLLARVLAPRGGEILFDGRSLKDWPLRHYAREVGYLPQDPDPVFPMKAIDVVLTGRAPFLGRFAWEGEADYVAAESALQVCDAAHLAERHLDEMSGGERKRVFLARVLAASPKLILLDEPLAALDISHMQQVSALLRDIVDRTGCTVLFASHDLNWAAAYSDRMLVLQRGRLVVDAAPADVMKPEVMRTFFGFESEAVLSGTKSWIVPRASS